MFVPREGLVYLGSQIFDTSEPERLHRIGFIPGTSPVDYSMTDRYLATADVHGLVKLYDIADPIHPEFISQVDFAPAYEVSVEIAHDDQTMFVCHEDRFPIRGGVFSIDISNEQNPRILDTLTNSLIRPDLILYDDIAVVMDWDKFYTIDISNPAEMEVLDQVNNLGFMKIFDWDHNNRLVAVVGNEELKFFDLANPRNVRLLCESRVVPTVTMARSGNFAYFKSGTNIVTYDCTVIDSPDSLRAVSMSRSNYYLQVDGDKLIAGGAGLDVLDISSPESPALAGRFGFEGRIWNLFAMENYFVCAMTDTGYSYVLNAEDPTYVRLTSIITDADNYYRGRWSVYNVLDSGFILAHRDSARTKDTIGYYQTNDLERTPFWQIGKDERGNLENVFVDYPSGLAVLQIEDWGVEVYRISRNNLERFDLAGSVEWETPEAVCDFKNEMMLTKRASEEGDTCYLKLYDLTDPSEPRVVDEMSKMIQMNYTAISGKIRGSRLYLHNYELYLLELDLESGIALRDSLPWDWEVVNFDVKYDNLAVAVKDSGLYVVDWEVIDTPELTGFYRMPNVRQVVLQGERIYTVQYGRQAGYIVSIMDASEALGMEMAQEPIIPEIPGMKVFPNPFNSTLTISFTTGRNAYPPRLGIYDINGREVFSAADPNSRGKMTPPTPPAIAGGDFQTLVWDATAQPAGIYFVRLQAGTEIVTEKVVLIR